MMNLRAKSTWAFIEKKIKEDRADLIDMLVKPNGIDETNVLRGKIQQLDELLDYPDRFDENDEEQ